MRVCASGASLCLLVSGLLTHSLSAITVQTVPVGNPGNAGDTRYNSISVGAVSYTYQIGKYAVTAGQYCAFLNAVAATDAYGLYDTKMDTANDLYGCNIKRTGEAGSYAYSVAADWANRPVNWVTWACAARFANWMNNGQPVGPQNTSTTEDGSYLLNGATTESALMAVTRKPGARWVIPTENEWYKAAYYDPAKPGGPGYWNYPTRNNTAPSNVLSAAGTNNANYWNGSYTIGAPYWRTEVGAFANSRSAYGTYDQGGCVWQWNETNVEGIRGIRGGSFYGYNLQDVQYLHAAWRSNYYPASPSSDFGFRLAYVPEPATAFMLALGSLAALWRPGRSRR